MPKNSPPDYVVQYQARQRQHVDRLLAYLSEVVERFEIELPGLDTASEEFQSKRMWCDGWGAMGRGLEGVLRTADQLAETDPSAAGYLLNHAVTIVNGMVTADEYTQSAHNRQVRELIPAIQAETRVDHTSAARAERERRVEERRKIVKAVVEALPADQRPTGADKLRSTIEFRVKLALKNAGLADVHHGSSTIRNDIVVLGLA